MNKKTIVIDDSNPNYKLVLDKLNLENFNVILASEHEHKEIPPINIVTNNKKIDLYLEPYYQKYNKKRTFK